MAADTIRVVEISPQPPSDGPRVKRPRALTRVWRAFRALIGRNRLVEVLWKVLIGLIGATVIAIGIIMLPTPVPGWLIIFAGLTILATEFSWAQRAAGWLRRQLAAFFAWWKKRRADRRDRRAREGA
ncbi:TIGR02611 family protein [Microbacterium amylolyticum]|uniref:Uncharacterized protein (TIGR02611 family) n=1 Tax=Microbacterium amylolyticum TaxID=936337 RepID=A0ABS4ZHA2_9MICO|nr:TIGR02611 family protein [Microbacterium amylolyticum]MBP2436428.1 uncharacterized protein (TIGR02611 family) [Microbacterium amylolyticum]